ncbi:hypothetical protein KW805_01220 [Candidatus Pacearchaeota archaeon]|nr:hypothetical protein [Candidatus Pacearchaeota archaeon]
MEEPEHIAQVLEGVKKGLMQQDSALLKELSNQTIHCACTVQDIGSITIAVLVYALSKLVERKDYAKVRNWGVFVKRFNSFLDLAIKAAKDDNEKKYEEYLAQARRALTSISVNLKPYIEEVIHKASINKASKVYEHGISLGQTSHILGVTQWELTEYMGQSQRGEEYNRTLDVRKRAKTALEFFS